jgi:putative phage-type endonuclease
MRIYTAEEAPQGSETWLNLRLGKFTCSDATPILTNGKGLETLAFTKVAERKSGMSGDAYDNPAMQNGREMEDTARNSYELEKGVQVKKVGFIEYDEWIGGSPDGLIGEDGLIEIKCPTNRVFVEYLYYKKIDPKYVAQMQMQMYISGRKFVDYVVFNPNFERSIVIVRVNYDHEIGIKLQEGLLSGVLRAKEILSKI